MKIQWFYCHERTLVILRDTFFSNFYLMYRKAISTMIEKYIHTWKYTYSNYTIQTDYMKIEPMLIWTLFCHTNEQIRTCLFFSFPHCLLLLIGLILKPMLFKTFSWHGLISHNHDMELATSTRFGLFITVMLQYIPRNMHTVLLCFALLWLCNRS